MSQLVNSESKSVWSKPFYNPIEYEMPKELAKQILATRKGAMTRTFLTSPLSNKSLIAVSAQEVLPKPTSRRRTASL